MRADRRRLSTRTRSRIESARSRNNATQGAPTERERDRSSQAVPTCSGRSRRGWHPDGTPKPGRRAAFDLAPHVTLNVRLRPRVSTLLVDPAVLRKLDDTELGWLRQASANVVGRTRELAELDAAEQPPDVPEGCAAEEPVTAVEGQDPEAWDGPTIPDGLTAVAQRLATSPARSQHRASTSHARTRASTPHRARSMGSRLRPCLCDLRRMRSGADPRHRLAHTRRRGDRRERSSSGRSPRLDRS